MSEKLKEVLAGFGRVAEQLKAERTIKESNVACYLPYGSFGFCNQETHEALGKQNYSQTISDNSHRVVVMFSPSGIQDYVSVIRAQERERLLEQLRAMPSWQGSGPGPCRAYREDLRSMADIERVFKGE